MVTQYKKNNPAATNESIATDIGMSTGALSDYFNGKNSNPNLATLKKFHDYFNVSYSYLAGESAFSDNDSADLLNSEIGMLKIEAMNYGRTYVIDSVIKNLSSLSGIPVFYNSGGNHDLLTKFLQGGQNYWGTEINTSALDGAESIISSIAKLHDNAFSITVDQINALQTINRVFNKEPKSIDALKKLICKIADDRDIFKQLDSAVADFKAKMTSAIKDEIARIGQLTTDTMEV